MNDQPEYGQVAAAMDGLQRRAREIAETALRDVDDFDDAERSISMALLLVQGFRNALHREEWLEAKKRHEQRMGALGRPTPDFGTT